MEVENGLNPFGTGQCLSTMQTYKMVVLLVLSQSLWNRAMSFDEDRQRKSGNSRSLNPFGTGQCLSTIGDLISPARARSQSLWNRAMSFDAINEKD